MVDPLQLVWAGISADTHTNLHFFERNMDSHVYIEDIVIPYIVPNKEFIGDNFLLIQDNGTTRRTSSD